MSPFFTASLSLVPGLGHWAVGKRKKSAALFAVDFGILCSILFFKSLAGRFLISFSYLTIMVPAVIETYILAQGGVSRFSESKPYIVALLLVTGFSGLPLLWQSSVFPQRIKIVWSLAVFVLAGVYFYFIGFLGIRFLKDV